MRCRPLICAVLAALIPLAPLVAAASDADTGLHSPAFDWTANGTADSPAIRLARSKDALAEVNSLNADASWVCTLAGSGKPSRCRRG